jgi:hypothetical protein
MKNYFFQICALLSLTVFLNCTREIEPALGTLEDKLWIQAYFDSYYGFRVSIDKAIPLSRDTVLYNEIMVADAGVYLLDLSTGMRRQAPYGSADKLYRIPGLAPDSGKSYQVIVEWNSEKFQSVPITVPFKPELTLQDKARKPFENLFGSGPGIELNYTLQIHSPIEKNQFYSVGAFFSPFLFERNASFSQFVQQESSCGYQPRIFPSVCMESSKGEIKPSLFIFQRAIMDTINLPANLYRGWHHIFFYSISPGFYAYTLSLKEPEPFERYFLNPTIEPTDFPGAFGQFVIRNLVSIDSIYIP